MNVCTCFLLFKIFALTNSLSHIKQKENGRRFNQALESMTKYSYEDTKNLNNRRDFTATVTDTPKVKTFTDFILETVNILNTYEDTAFQDFFHILDLEIIKFNYTGCKFSDLMQNHNTEKLLMETFKTIRDNPIIFTKTKINEMADMLRDGRYDHNLKEFLDYINYLYSNKEPEFYRVLNNLKRFTKTRSMEISRKDLEQVIRDGIQTILFNHYTQSNTFTRRELKDNIETFWEKFKEGPASNAIKNENEEPETVDKNDPQTKNLDRKEKIVSIESYDEQSQDKEREDDVNSFQSETLATDNITEKISSGQSFDSSLNSIKHSQEQYEQHNTHRYMTLYTEEISYKARTTKTTEIIPILENVMTSRPTVSRRSTTTPRYRPKDVIADRKKKVKNLRINRDTYDPFDVSLFSNHESEDDLSLKLKRLPRARVHSDKQRRAIDMSTDLTNADLAVIAVQSANYKLLKSLSMLAGLSIFGSDTKTDTSLYQNSPGHNKSEPIKNKKPDSFLQAQDEIKPQKPNAVAKSPTRYSKRKEYLYTKQPNELRRSIEPNHLNKIEVLAKKILNDNKQKSVRLHDNTKVKHFNEFVNLKIKTIEKELTELKQANNVITILTNNNTDEVNDRNVTDNDAIKEKDKRKNMKENFFKLLDRLREINNEEFGDEHTSRSNTMKTLPASDTKTPLIAKVVMKTRAMDMVNDATSQTTDNNVIITEELKEGVSTDDVTTNNTVADRIIRHKNPFDHLDMKFSSRTL